MITRLVWAIHDLALALMVGGVAGGAIAALILFERAPTREVAGQIGQTIFDRLGVIVLALALAVVLARLLLRRLQPASRTLPGLPQAVICVILAGLIALWMTPAMHALWVGAPHAEDGSGLTGEAKSRFMRLHGAANLAYIAILLAGSWQIALGAGRKAAP